MKTYWRNNNYWRLLQNQSITLSVLCHSVLIHSPIDFMNRQTVFEGRAKFVTFLYTALKWTFTKLAGEDLYWSGFNGPIKSRVIQSTR